MLKNILLTLFLLGNSLFSLTQAEDFFIQRQCANPLIEQQYLLENYTYDQLRNARLNARQTLGDTTYSVPLVNTDTTYTIQVVVHLIYIDDDKYQNISDEIVQSQIDALNRDYNLQNDLSYIRPEFARFIGNPKIKFELAKVDPKGKPTTGITRKKSSPLLLPDWNPVFDNIKNTSSGGQNAWSPKKYLNIWVCDLNMSKRKSKHDVDVNWDQGLLGGYANPPQGLPNWNLELLGLEQSLAATPPIRQGVVIDFRFFGQNNEFAKDYLNNSPHYTLGRTTVHEVGHYLGLRHTWGDLGPLLQAPCDQYDDGIVDTPMEESAFSSNAQSGVNICSMDINSCNSPYPGNGIDYPDMRENYMDYSSDMCYAMFTKEQVNMMRYALTTKRNEIITERAVLSTPTALKNYHQIQASIYPNPTQDKLNIQLNQPLTQESSILIYNVVGKLMIQSTLTAGTVKQEVDLNQLAPGAYITVVQNEQNRYTAKFIKE